VESLAPGRAAYVQVTLRRVYGSVQIRSYAMLSVWGSRYLYMYVMKIRTCGSVLRGTPEHAGCLCLPW
jgi:hypothetical protein